jgi:hypothetical protein
MPTPPEKLRKQYHNSEFPNVILRFEDGHEIEVLKGKTKAFDAYKGERIKILAMYDPTSKEREKVDTWRAEQFQDSED